MIETHRFLIYSHQLNAMKRQYIHFVHLVDKPFIREFV